MAKKRKDVKSAFDNTSKEELSAVGKSILKKAEGEEKSSPSPTPLKQPTRKTINKVIYISEETHKKARLQAVMMDMNIKDYVTYLIERNER